MSRRLFEQSENNDPSLTKKIAFGGASVTTENITFTNFVTWLYGKLGFLKVTEDLDDLNDKPTARTNLGVYSSGETDDLLDLKAPLYPEVGGALGSNNTVTFTPSGNYNPATKLYVDDGGISTGWLNGTQVYASATDFLCKVARVGGFNTVNGTIKYPTGLAPSEGATIFTLPASIPTCTIDIHFTSSDSSGDDISEFIISAGTRNVVAGPDSSTNTIQKFSVTYPHI